MVKKEILRFKAPSYPVCNGVVKVGDVVWFRGVDGTGQLSPQNQINQEPMRTH